MELRGFWVKGCGVSGLRILGMGCVVWGFRGLGCCDFQFGSSQGLSFKLSIWLL